MTILNLLSNFKITEQQSVKKPVFNLLAPQKTSEIFEKPIITPEMHQAKSVGAETVVTLSSPDMSGSGVIINKKISGKIVTGTILTNGHVVGTQSTKLVGQNIQIKLPNGQIVVGRVKANGIKYAPFTGEIYTGGIVPKRTLRNSIDIAVIEFTINKNNRASNFKVAKLGNDVNVGEEILSVGTPEKSKNKVFSSGIVIDRTRALSDGATQVSNAKVIEGMSGGGVFNETGHLVGINEQKNCNCRMTGANGRVYNWPEGATAGGIEASTIKTFLKTNNIEFTQ